MKRRVGVHVDFKLEDEIALMNPFLRTCAQSDHRSQVATAVEKSPLKDPTSVTINF